MPDRQRASQSFRDAADREYHEIWTIIESLPRKAQQVVANEQEKARHERERTEQQQRNRREAEVKKEKERLEKDDKPDQTYDPPAPSGTKRTKTIISAQSRAEHIVDQRHKAELDAIDQRLDDRVAAILAEHGIDKVRALDKDRRHMEELAAQKRADKDATRTEAGRVNTPSPSEPAKDAKTREKEFLKRVAARLRKSKERDEHSRGGHGDGR